MPLATVKFRKGAVPKDLVEKQYGTIKQVQVVIWR
jgi:FKBP-type peptidyl-prolyl cis-trans isomerase (trigger factor)